MAATSLTRILLLALLVIPQAIAKPIAGAEGANVKIVFTDDPCTLAEVKNLPYAATWTENGKVTAGCWGIHPQFHLVMTYWADRTVAIIPPEAVHPLYQVSL